MPKKENKKIRNATICKSGSIVFKSQLEKMAYNTLLEYGFTPQYEPRRLILVEGFKPTIPFYDKELLERAAKDSGLCQELFENNDEKPTNSFLYSLIKLFLFINNTFFFFNK